MPTKSKPHIIENKKEIWEARIKEWEASGLSKALFCKKRSLSKSSFWKWYGRLAENFKKDKFSFIPIKIKKGEIELSSPLLILLKGDIKIAIPKDVNASTLKMLLETLGVLPC
jgi:hypothetical protein